MQRITQIYEDCNHMASRDVDQIPICNFTRQIFGSESDEVNRSRRAKSLVNQLVRHFR